MFILQGNGSPRNRGCEAILRSTIAILKQEFGSCRFVDAPAGGDFPADYVETEPGLQRVLPPPMPRRWSPQWCAYQAKYRLLRRAPIKLPCEPYLHEAAATLTLGGDNYSLDYGRPYPFFWANDLVLKHRVPLVLWGASVGPFSADKPFERYAARKLKEVTLICARESETVAYLDSLGVRDNVRMVADPAFLLEPQPAELSAAEKIVLQEPCVGLNLSPLLARYLGSPAAWLDRATECVEAVVALLARPVVLVPHVFQPPANDDHAFMAEICRRLGGCGGRLHLLEPRHNCRQMKWIISKLHAFAGARTHATIAALSSATPTLSIGYSIKARGLNKDIFGHLDWMIAHTALTPDGLAERMAVLVEAASELRQKLTQVMPAYKARARAGGELVRGVIALGAES